MMKLNETIQSRIMEAVVGGKVDGLTTGRDGGVALEFNGITIRRGATDGSIMVDLVKDNKPVAHWPPIWCNLSAGETITISGLDGTVGLQIY